MTRSESVVGYGVPRGVGETDGDGGGEPGNEGEANPLHAFEIPRSFAPTAASAMRAIPE